MDIKQAEGREQTIEVKAASFPCSLTAQGCTFWPPALIACATVQGSLSLLYIPVRNCIVLMN